MFAQRAQLEKEAKEKYDRWICQSIWKMVKDKGFQTVHGYLPMGTEIDVSPLIETLLQENIKVITPKTFPKRRLQHLVLSSLDELEDGVFGTRHPANAEEHLGSYDLILVPGLAFDPDGNRLGYGGGYYDQFLLQHPKAFKLGLLYPFQQVEEVPLEDHDFQLDALLVGDGL